MKLAPLVFLALIAAPALAQAQGTVEITLTPEGQDLADALGITVDDLEAQTEEDLAELYNVNRVDEFLRAFADATAFSGRGIGVDYASNSDGLMFGLTANIAAAVGDLGQAEVDPETEHPVAGVAPNFALMGGLNLAKWKRPQLSFYGNLFYRSGDWGYLHGSIASLGLHAQYKFFSPTEGKKSYLVKWGGFDVTAGLEMSRWAFGLATDEAIETTHTIDGASDSSDVRMSAKGQFDLNSTGVVAPLEVTTSLRFLYFASVYGGASVNLQAGRTSLGADLTGDMEADDPQGGDPLEIGSAEIRVNGASGPSVGKITFLAGLQVNIWKLKVFTQANFMPVRAASIAFGLRLVL